MTTWQRLIISRKFWLAILAVVHTIVTTSLKAPAELWLPVNGLLAAVILTLAWEDAAAKRSGRLMPSSLPVDFKWDPWLIFERLVRSRKVWLAAIGCAQTYLFYFIPTFDKEVWLSIDGLLVMLMSSFAWEDAGEKGRV